MISSRAQSIIWIALYAVIFTFISRIARVEFIHLLAMFALAGLIYFYFFVKRIELSPLVALSVILAMRIPFFFELPALSDDFYRYLWDGMLLNHGINPFGKIPEEQYLRYLRNVPFAELLLDKMNSPQYASVYPTIHQVVFGIAYFLSGAQLLSGVNYIRTLILLAEIVLFVFILFRGRRNRQYVFYYLLNPLVAIEGVGNAHLEAIVVPFLALALISFNAKWTLRPAVGMAFATATKLTPAFLLPAIFFKTHSSVRRQFASAFALSLIILLGLLQPWNVLQTFDKGFGLYYGNFEFNASVYYAINLLVSAKLGYNAVSVVAPALSIAAALSIVVIAWRYRRAELFELCTVCYLVFLLCSAVVHPWYILPLLFLCLCARRFALLVWGVGIFLSYSHYAAPLGPKWGYLAVEYGTLAVAIGVEAYKRRWLQAELRG